MSSGLRKWGAGFCPPHPYDAIAYAHDDAGPANSTFILAIAYLSFIPSQGARNPRWLEGMPRFTTYINA